VPSAAQCHPKPLQLDAKRTAQIQANDATQLTPEQIPTDDSRSYVWKPTTN